MDNHQLHDAATTLAGMCATMTAVDAAMLCGITVAQAQTVAGMLGEQYAPPSPDRLRVIARAAQRAMEDAAEHVDDMEEVALE